MDVPSEFFVGQKNYSMYVQSWPAAPNPQRTRTPLVLVHGGAHTGTCWTTTPDGRQGWAHRFAAAGWPVYVVDWPGVGRSSVSEDFLTMGPAPVLDALAELLAQIGPATLVGHSIGAALSLKLADRDPDLVRAIVAVTPGPVGNAEFPLPLRPMDVPVLFDRDAASHLFANAQRFPHAAFEQYLSSLIPLSPSIENALGNRGNKELWIDRPDVVRRRPILLIAGDEDDLASEPVTQGLADLLGIRRYTPGRDWGLHGFGHMMPIELGTEKVVDRVVDWFDEFGL